MATISLKFRASAVIGGEGTVYFQIIHKRVIRQINTGLKVLPHEWEGKSATIRLGAADGERAAYLRTVAERLQWDRQLLRKVIVSLADENEDYAADDIVRIFGERARQRSFLNFMFGVSVRLGEYGQAGTMKSYSATLRSFTRFRNGEDVLFDGFDSGLMIEYEAWLKARGVAMNTVSFYMRILRAVYNRAVERGLTEQRNPFRHVYTGVGKTAKRAIDASSVRKIRDLDLRCSPLLSYARDLFLFSFYTRGMSFIDMAFLRKKDLRGGILTYRRHKTGQLLTMRWENEMRTIAERYSGGDSSPYLLSIIKNVGEGERREYESALHLVNSKLKEVARLAGLHVSLTMYCARHSWANIARSKNIPVAVISEGMGHDSEKTTQIYLSSIETSVVDRANRKILRGL